MDVPSIGWPGDGRKGWDSRLSRGPFGRLNGEDAICLALQSKAAQSAKDRRAALRFGLLGVRPRTESVVRALKPTSTSFFPIVRRLSCSPSTPPHRSPLLYLYHEDRQIGGLFTPLSGPRTTCAAARGRRQTAGVRRSSRCKLGLALEAIARIQSPFEFRRHHR